MRDKYEGIKNQLRMLGYSDEHIKATWDAFTKDGTLQTIDMGIFEFFIHDETLCLRRTLTFERLIEAGVITDPDNWDQVCDAFYMLNPPDDDEIAELVQKDLDLLVEQGEIEKVWSQEHEDFVYRLKENNEENKENI